MDYMDQSVRCSVCGKETSMIVTKVCHSCESAAKQAARKAEWDAKSDTEKAVALLGKRSNEGGVWLEKREADLILRVVESHPAQAPAQASALTDEQINEIWWEVERKWSNGASLASVSRSTMFARALLAASPKAEPVSEDKRDAARYRWLREQDWFSGPLCVLRDPKRVLTSGIGLGADCPSRSRLDTAIDELSATTSPTKEST